MFCISTNLISKLDLKILVSVYERVKRSQQQMNQCETFN